MLLAITARWLMELTGRFVLTAIPANANQHCFPPMPRRNAPDPQFFASGGKAAEGVWADLRNLPPPSTIPGANATDNVCHAPLTCEAGGTFILRQHPRSMPLKWLGRSEPVGEPAVSGLPRLWCRAVSPVKSVCMSLRKKGLTAVSCKPLKYLVGRAGIEPATLCLKD